MDQIRWIMPYATPAARARAWDMVERCVIHRQGLKQIASAYGISVERTRQILRKTGVDLEEHQGVLREARVQAREAQRVTKLTQAAQIARAHYLAVGRSVKVIGTSLLLVDGERVSVHTVRAWKPPGLSAGHPGYLRFRTRAGGRHVTVCNGRVIELQPGPRAVLRADGAGVARDQEAI